MLARLAVAATTALAIGHAGAAAVTPTYDTFGALAAATFGGSGIPNHSVAITTSVSGVTLGLSASERFSGNPVVTNNGAGRFTAAAGIDTNAPSPGDPHARWNFNFYLAGTGLGAYTFVMLYDFDPGVGTDAADHGSITLPGSLLGSPTQNSWNLGMNFLDIAASGLIPPPSFGAFSPSSAGEYSFAIVAYNSAGAEVGRTAIVVNAVPEPGTLGLLGIALLGFAVTRRRG